MRHNFVLEAVKQADWDMVCEILGAVIRRSGELHPEEELVAVMLPKHDLEERRRILARLGEMLQGSAEKA